MRENNRIIEYGIKTDYKTWEKLITKWRIMFPDIAQNYTSPIPAKATSRQEETKSLRQAYRGLNHFSPTTLDHPLSAIKPHDP